MAAEEIVRYNFVATGVGDVANAYQNSTKAAERAIQAEVRAHERAVAHVTRIRDRYFAQQQRIEERAARNAARTQERAVANSARIKERYFVQQQRDQERRDRAIARAQEKAAKDQSRRFTRIGERVGGAVTGAATAGVLGTAALVGVAARQAVQTRETAGRIAINAAAAGAKPVDAAALRQSFENVAIATPGVSSRDVGAAAQAYQSKMGQVLNEEQLQVLATAASASGSSIVDLSDAMAALGKHMDIKTVDQFKDALSTLISQGARGAFELKDAASEYRELASAAGFFGLGKGVEGVKTLGGLTQVAMSATGSPEEASTSLRNMFLKLVSEAPGLKQKYGVNVYDDKGKARDVVPVLLEVIKAAGGNDLVKKRGELISMFDLRAVKSIGPLLDAYAAAQINGTDAVAAMTAVIEDAAGTSGTWADRQREAAAAQDMASAQLGAAWERVLQVVDAQVVPALLPLAEQLPTLVEAIVPLIGLFGDLASVIADFAKLIPGVDSDKLERRERRGAAARELRELEGKMRGPGGAGTPTLEDLEKAAALEYEIGTLDAIAKAPAAGEGGAEELKKRLAKQTAGLTLATTAVGGALGGKPGAAIGAGIGLLTGKAAAEQQAALMNAPSGANIITEGYESGMRIPDASEVYSLRNPPQQAPSAQQIDAKAVNDAFAAVVDAANRLANGLDAAGAPTAGTL